MFLLCSVWRKQKKNRRHLHANLPVRLFELRDELRPADVGRAQVLVVQTREADVHQYFAQAVVHRVQHEALRQRVVAPRLLQQLPGAAASEALRGRAGRRGGGGQGRGQQLSGGAEERPVFEGGPAEAEGGVVVARRQRGTAWRADGAEVQNVLGPFAHGCYLPGFVGDATGGLAGRGGGQVAAAFDGGLEGELPIGAVVCVQLCVPRVMERGGLGGETGVKQSVVGAEEDGLLLPRVDQVLLAPRAPRLSLRGRFGRLAFNGRVHRLFLHLHLLVFALHGIHRDGWTLSLSHLLRRSNAVIAAVNIRDKTTVCRFPTLKQQFQNNSRNSLTCDGGKGHP